MNMIEKWNSDKVEQLTDSDFKYFHYFCIIDISLTYVEKEIWLSYIIIIFISLLSSC